MLLLEEPEELEEAEIVDLVRSELGPLLTSALGLEDNGDQEDGRHEALEDY